MCNKCNCETAKSNEPIPFDLEAAKRGEPIQTRDGRAGENKSSTVVVPVVVPR